MREKDVERFWAKVDIRGPNECWEWTAGCFAAGYGAFRVGGATMAAHRLALAIDGRDPGAMWALHSCDNRACVNPAHLRRGDRAENTTDAFSRNRRLRGNRHDAKLTPRDVAQARLLWAGGHSQTSIARRFGVSQAAISAVVNGKTWRHVG